MSSGGAPAPGADDDDIRGPLRLGWALAEVRGRIRLGDDPILHRRDLPRRHDGALPLFAERTPGEQHIEAVMVLDALSDHCGVAAMPMPHYRDGGAVPRPHRGERPPDYLRRLDLRLDELRASGGDAGAVWQRIADVFRRWDQHIQDTLACGPFGGASAYQLGRGLAETFWALDPTARPGDINSWQFLLGQGRQEILCILVDRISFSLRPFTADAVKGSLSWWVDYVASAGRPSPAARLALLKQVTIWRDLLSTDTDPLNLLPPRRGVAGARRILPVVRGYTWELALVLLSLAALVVTAVLLGRGDRGGAVTAVLGIFGAGGAATVAVVKSATQEVGSQLRRAINRDLSTEAATTLLLHRRRGRMRAELPEQLEVDSEDR